MSPEAGRPSAVSLRVPKNFLGFFDDAAIFPPGLAALDHAVHNHVRRRTTVMADAVGSLILPLHVLSEAKKLAAAEDLSEGAVRINVVTPAGELQRTLESIPAVSPELLIAAIELKTSTNMQDWSREIREAADVAGVDVYVELTAEQIAAGALDLVEGTRLQLKYRAGGLEAHLFPTPAEMAHVIAAAVARQIPFKLTAGLHEAVRHTSATGDFTHHGFLNIAIATGLAQLGARIGELEAVLSETETDQLVERYVAQPDKWRRSFTSFGTCSVSEPLESLERLRLCPTGLADLQPEEEENQ